ncbi:MAG: Gfo/Idh/MocA family oxidoreductase [Fimbriimonadales bacterium]|nr:Gfo/Idh/MocA family oxidoreductase [Fimbriimonadales bacterium]
MDKVRLGVVGCGAIFPTHADAIQRIGCAELAAVHDVLPERTEAAAAKYGCHASPTLEDLLQRVDAVSVCVPSGLHAEVGILAARAGRHVLVEKPIDTTLPKAERLVRACEEAEVRLGVISQHRFANDIQAARSAVQGGLLGPMLAGDAYIKWFRTQVYYDSGDWRGTWDLDGGGCLMNQGVHYIDMLQWIMGPVRAVRACCRTLAHDIEVEDVANALLEFESGAVGVLQGSTSCFPGFAERLELHGRHGTIVIEGDIAKVWEIWEDPVSDRSKYGRGVACQPTPNLHAHGSGKQLPHDPTAQWGEQHRLQIEDFCRATLEGREPFLTGRMALEPLRVILAVYESSRRGGERVCLEEIA